MARVPFTVLRGNVSELQGPDGRPGAHPGVDAGGADAVTEAELERGVAFAKGDRPPHRDRSGGHRGH